MSRATGPVFLITGATGGIGSALCRQLAERGARLFLVARNQERLDALAAEVEGATLSADMATFDGPGQAFEAALERYGQVDGAANLIGSILLKPAHLTTEQDWLTTLHLNLTSAFGLVRAAGRHMRDRGGSIVLMSSAAARIGLVNHGALAAAKAGVIGLARASAATYASHGIRINAVAPGLVDTPMAARITGNASAREASTSLHPLKRIGEPAEVARMIAWLLDPDNGWVTGQVFGIDGGLACVRSRGS